MAPLEEAEMGSTPGWGESVVGPMLDPDGTETGTTSEVEELEIGSSPDPRDFVSFLTAQLTPVEVDVPEVAPH